VTVLAALRAGLGLALAVSVVGPCSNPARSDSRTERARADLRVFTGWLTRFGVRGYIGEVGWPGDNPVRAARWNPVGEAWYRDADAAGLWVTYWSAGEWWPPHHPLVVYGSPDGGPSPVSEARPQAAVVEAHRSTGDSSRGVSDSGAEFGAPSWKPPASDFSNVNPGRYGEDWHYDRAETFTYLASRGVGHIRLPFRWERLQPTLGGPLEATELGRIKGAVARAHAAGLRVILDVHNFASYRLFDASAGKGVARAIGSPEVTADHFCDLWRRLSAEFRADPGILAYGLMNEPTGMPGASVLDRARLWERVSQQAVDAIRAAGDTTLVMVGGYGFSDAYAWDRRHPAPWIRDPAGNVRYEAHAYFDSDRTGAYTGE